MPCDLVRVLTVTPSQATTKYGEAFQSALVDAELLEPPNLRMQFVTSSVWRAAYCDQARKLSRPIYVTWDYARYGKTIRMVQRYAVVRRDGVPT